MTRSAALHFVMGGPAQPTFIALNIIFILSAAYGQTDSGSRVHKTASKLEDALEGGDIGALLTEGVRESANLLSRLENESKAKSKTGVVKSAHISRKESSSELLKELKLESRAHIAAMSARELDQDSREVITDLTSRSRDGGDGLGPSSEKESGDKGPGDHAGKQDENWHQISAWVGAVALPMHATCFIIVDLCISPSSFLRHSMTNKSLQTATVHAQMGKHSMCM
jgi:hypothetical protein